MKRLKLACGGFAVLSMCWLAVPSFSETNTLSHMTTRQKVDYAKQLREAGCLGAAIDAMCEAMEDLLPKESDSNSVIHLDSRPSKPIKGQSYRFGKDPNTHTYLGGGAWSSTLLHWIEE